MSEEFNIFKNLDDLRNTNLLDHLKSMESAKTIDPNDSQFLDNDDFDFDVLVNNVKKSPIIQQLHQEKNTTSKKKSKKNSKSRRSSTSTDGSISPTLPLLESLSKNANKMPVRRRTRRSMEACKKVAETEIILEHIEPTSNGRGRGKGRSSGRGRGRRNRSNTRSSQNINNCSGFSESFLGIPTNTSSSEVCTHEANSDHISSTLTVMERFLQQGRNGRSRVMRARRQYLSERAARSNQVDFIDLVSSPMPRVEGFIELDSDTEETTRTTRSKKKNYKFTIDSSLSKSSTNNISFDEDNPELNIKINWKGKTEAFKLRRYQKFSLIFKQLADRENISTECIVFNLNDRIIMADDTPDSISYKIYQFIDGRILSNRFNSPGTVAAASKRRDINKINLKIQSDNWKRPLQIDIMKTDKFRILYIKCAEELKVDLDRLKLSFDGELIEINDTPADLDLEGGEAIDLRIKN